MPWQQHVLDTALEVDPQTGRLVYREVRLTVPRQSGKALALDTPLLTANRGWVNMSSVVAGDRVFHPGGHDVEVIHVSDIMLGHDCYRVTTSDGRSVVADADHLWTVVDKRRERSVGSRGSRRRHFETVTLTTAEMAATGTSRYQAGSRMTTTGGKRYQVNEYRYMLPPQEPLKSPETELPIDPYLLGAWLGDGTSAGASLTVGDADLEFILGELGRVGAAVIRRRRDPRTGAWTVAFRIDARMRDGFQARASRLGVWRNKHVPEQYLISGPAQRESLLQGLLDTDGTIDGAHGQVEFCSMNLRLAEAVLFLARSLGWRTTLRTGRATIGGRDCGAKYRVQFTPVASDPFSPFRMPRKAARIRPVDGGAGRRTVSVKAIEPVESVPVRCIKVDSPDGLFLAGRDLVATHNTTLILAKNIHRMLRGQAFGGRQRLLYTAQTRKKAREKFVDDYIEELKTAKALRGRWREQLGYGSESIRWQNGSIWGIESNTEKAGHGGTLDVGDIDEAFAQVDSRLEQAMKPAMITRPQPQLWVVSTAGTETSVYLRDKVDAGRKFAEQGKDTGVAYFEWSADRDADPFDPATWWSCMPALGHTVTQDAVQADLDGGMTKADFCRAYLNWWMPKVADDPIIPVLEWQACEDSASVIEGPKVWAVDVSPDSSQASIAVAGTRRDGRPHIELVEAAAGTGWIVQRVGELLRAHQTSRIRVGERQWRTGVLIDAAGPAGELVPKLKAAGIDPYVVNTTGLGQACGGLQTSVHDRVVVHTGQEQLGAALKGSARRPLGDGAWAFARKRSDIDITPIVAVTLALHGFRMVEAVRPAGPLVATG